jgi:hypothetical protein
VEPPAGEDGLELPQDPEQEHRAYVLRTVGAVVFAVLLAAGLLGLLGGGGPLGERREGNAGDGVVLRYERFLQWGRPDELHVRLGGGAGRADVAISRDYLDGVDVAPAGVEPERTTTLPDRTVFTFDARAPAEIVFSIDPRKTGRRRGVVLGPGGSSATVDQWVYP